MVRPTARHAYGLRRLIHLAEHERGVLENTHLHLEEEVGALTGAPDAGEHGGTGELTRDTGDHLLIRTVLPTPAPPNRPILPP